MRVTTGPPRRVVTVVAGAAIVPAMLLVFVIATAGGTAPQDEVDDVDNAVIPPARATTQDAGPVDPWAAGDAAALQELADIGRAGLHGCR